MMSAGIAKTIAATIPIAAARGHVALGTERKRVIVSETAANAEPAALVATEEADIKPRLGFLAKTFVALCSTSLVFGIGGASLGALQAPDSTITASQLATSDQRAMALPVLDAVELPLASAPGEQAIGVALAGSDGNDPAGETADERTTLDGEPGEGSPGENTNPVAVVAGSTLATAKATEGTVEVYASPNDPQPTWSLGVPTEFGGLRHFLVIGESGDWLEVQVPVRPNGSTGWVARSDVDLSPIEHRVVVDLSDRSLVVWEGDRIVLDTTGAVGRPSAPTPEGTFFIRDIFEWNPDSVYGPWVLALSSYSEVIDQINGGDAVVAIHGTNAPNKLGQAVSLGCIRLDNDMVSLLAQTVGPGTPIEIVA